MMKNRKKLAVVIAIVILTLSLASTGFAANTMKTLQAYYRNVTIFRNGAQATFSHEPFIVDGTTYVPVRDMSELLGKTVSFNPTTYRIDITDVADANTVMLQTKMIQQEIEITNLNAKVKELEAKLAEKEDSTLSKNSSLSDVQKYLNKNYSPDSGVDFEIALTGSKSKIEIAIYVDDRSSSNNFADWTNSDKKSYAEELVDEIMDVFPTAKISGFYKDDYLSNSSKQSFSVSTSGKVTMGNINTGFSSLEDELNRSYYYKGDVEFNLQVSGDKYDIVLNIDAFRDDLDSLSQSQIKSYLENIYDYIMNEYRPDSITGTIFDYYIEYDFDFSSNGYASLY